MNRDVGRFIQELRKEKGLTQRELADIIGMSDKTISKWENGNSMPDTSMLISLSEALEVSVNELLTCEKISPEQYSMKAEETIMNLMKENESTKKKNRIAQIIGVSMLAIASVLLCFTINGGDFGIVVQHFIDIPTLILMTIFTIGVVLASGVRSKRDILKVISKSIIPVGGIVATCSVIILLCRLSDPQVLGPNLAVALVSMLYVCIVKLIVDVMLVKQMG